MTPLAAGDHAHHRHGHGGFGAGRHLCIGAVFSSGRSHLRSSCCWRCFMVLVVLQVHSQLETRSSSPCWPPEPSHIDPSSPLCSAAVCVLRQEPGLPGLQAAGLPLHHAHSTADQAGARHHGVFGVSARPCALALCWPLLSAPALLPAHSYGCTLSARRNDPHYNHRSRCNVTQLRYALNPPCSTRSVWRAWMLAARGARPARTSCRWAAGRAALLYTRAALCMKLL